MSGESQKKSMKERTAKRLEKVRNTKILYKLPVYEIERAEKRYEAMAERGWILRKQGGSFERYEKGEPQKLQYRIEYCPVKTLDGIQELSDEQVDFYEDCGWKLVSERRGVYVFAAPVESEPVELYSDPKEQIRMLKSVHNYIGSFGATYICCWVGSILGKALTGEQSLLSWEAFHCIDWIWICSAILLMYVIWENGYGAFRCHQLVRRVKRGKPIHHLPGERQSRHLAAKSVKTVLLTLAGITAVGSAVMLAGVTKTSLSEVGQERPYILGSEVYEGERSDIDLFGYEEKNSVTHASALTADYYEVSEYLKDGQGGFVSLDQKVYVLRNIGGDMSKRAVRLADSLLKGSVFRDDGRQVLEYPGFDYVATAQYTMVAVRGNYVIRVTCIATDKLEKDWSAVLDVLAEKWK